MSGPTEELVTPARTKRRVRADGRRSREVILEAGVRAATVDGLDGLSIGDLATLAGMSKAGVYAHFGSKEELQLAIISRAEAIYLEEIVMPALQQPEPFDRLIALCENFLSYVQAGTFPGGCFFASANAELDTRPGRVRDRLVATYTKWTVTLTSAIVQAQATGQLSREEDPKQLAFEISSHLHQANDLYVLYGDLSYMDMARKGLSRLLVRQASTA